MIFDSLDNAHLYEGVLPQLKDAFAYVKAMTAGATVGRTDLAGGAFVTVSEGQTKPCGQGLFEHHVRYVDLQVVLSGEEVMEMAPLPALRPQVPYDEARDAAFSSGEAAARIAVKPGFFYLVWPQDAHAGCLHADAPTYYKKAIVKIPVA